MTDFRTVALALQPYISNTYDLLNAADAVLSALDGAATPNLAVREVTPALIDYACHNPAVLDYMGQTKKINAIKVLRDNTGCGLKAAKDAVEHSDVSLAALRYKLTGQIR
jgi:ribosomal protein L7/L12